MPANISEAFIQVLQELEQYGQTVPSRVGETKELRAVNFNIDHPLERFHAIPHRNANPFAQVAETLWVLAGRNDITWLSRYLPRADEFSDDGKTWRAGYGPRLRHWRMEPGCERANEHVDQVAECVTLLTSEPETRRAVISLWDPEEDLGTDTKDVPCNNWIQFLQRDGVLHMHIVARSMDVMWGLSGINAFEWSVLHEMMAYWTHTMVGKASYFIGSLHLYERHYERVKRILEATRSNSNGEWAFDTSHARFQTPFEKLDTVLDGVFQIERQLGEGERLSDIPAARWVQQDDPFLYRCLQMLALWNYNYLRGNDARTRALIAVLPYGWHQVAWEYYERTWKPKAPSIWVDGPTITLGKLAPLPFEGHFQGIAADLIRLHDVKGRAYGDSWRKHGEVLSIFANITRKVDRLEIAYAEGTPDESKIDTVADLAVYSVKYLTWLAEKWPIDFGRWSNVASEGLSFTEMLEVLRHHASRSRYVSKWGGYKDCQQSWKEAYDWIENVLVNEVVAPTSTKISQVAMMALAAIRWLDFVYFTDRARYDTWAKQWEEPEHVG